MSNVVTENVLLLVPVFFSLMIFTIVVNNIVSNYDMQQKLIIVEGSMDRMTSTIQQLYYTLSIEEVQPCSVTKSNPLPQMIDNQPYRVSGTFKDNVLTLTFNFPGINLTQNATVTLGPLMSWGGGTLISTNPNASIIIEKDGSGKMNFSFR
jgi:hypothetical protein